MSIKVCKFGGSSVADAKQINKVRSIVQSDSERRFIIPSAPGKSKHVRARNEQLNKNLLVPNLQNKSCIIFKPLFFSKL